MHTSLRRALVASLIATAAAGAQTQSSQATAAPMPTAPAVGDAAPDFTVSAADSSGMSAPVSLSALRGKVVVLAFYPKDRTQGCTAEMTKFRDEYTTLFGEGVVILPASADDIASHTSWSKDAHFPFTMISDPTGALATKYGSKRDGAAYFNRTVFVIGKDGKITYSDMRFGALSQDAYDKLAAAIKSAKGA
jgi:thioredoxin-dependent peroxiredoxin